MGQSRIFPANPEGPGAFPAFPDARAQVLKGLGRNLKDQDRGKGLAWGGLRYPGGACLWNVQIPAGILISRPALLLNEREQRGEKKRANRGRH